MDAFALRGVSRGCVSVESNSQLKIGCYVGSPSLFPAWIFFSNMPSLKLDWLIIHPTSLWLSFLGARFPEVKTLTCFPNAIDIDFLLCDGPPPGRSHPVWNAQSLRYVLATNTPRRAVQGWHMFRRTLRHSEVGGVSDGSFPVFVFSKLPTSSLCFASKPARDISSIVDVTVGVGDEVPPCDTKSLRVPHVKRTKNGFLSQFSLFPLTSCRHRVVVPSVFSHTGWTCRRLSIAELLHVKDVPLQLVKLLSPRLSWDLYASIPIPLKILCCLLQAVMECSVKHPFSISRTGGGGCLSLGHDSKSATIVPGASPNAEEVKECKPLASTQLDECKPHAPSQLDFLKATKADDAAIPTYIWDHQITRLAHEIRALEGIRTLGLLWWKRSLLHSYVKWLYLHTAVANHKKKVHEWVIWHRKSKRYQWSQSGRAGYLKCWKKHRQLAPLDIEAGLECIARAANSTWWEWTDGSRPFFWKWNPDYQLSIRDGVPPWLEKSPEKWVQPQMFDKKNQAQVTAKLYKVWKKRRYLETGFVRNLTRFFAVPKGETDIRMVYDSTVAKLNDCLWAPWFAMPTVRNHLRAIDVGSYMADVDIGEMFLNFILHPKVKPYCGVDLTKYFPKEVQDNNVLWVRWSRCCMGLKSSPYNCVQGIMHLAETILGDPTDTNNPFQWVDVILNLPGSNDYDPGKPWVYKIRLDGKIACDIFIYVDDLRPTGPTEETCRAAARRTASILNSRGIQDASRKRRPPSRTPGAWAGSMISTTDSSVRIEVAQDKWEKTQKQIEWIIEHFEDEGGIPFKPLERIRGFLVYTTRTYPAMVPYLKGIHLTLDGWREGRDDEGWKLIGVDWNEGVDDPSLIEEESDGDSPPCKVKPVPRLKDDVEALSLLTESKLAPKRVIRNSRVVTVVYGFGDASGKGFGTGLKIEGQLFYRFGEWCSEISELSSNYRELYNLVLGIQELAQQGKLTGAEIFLFTDNSTAEGAFFRGTSSNRRLFELILSLRKLEHDHGFVLHVIHISGLRMIASGIDGLSRGDTADGIMGGAPVLSFVPLHLPANRRCETLITWIREWFVEELTVLDAKGWFTTGHQGDKAFMWIPAPSAAEVALEQLCLARHKRTTSTHIFVVPRLMTAYWRKQLGKVSDFMFTVPIGTSCWPEHMYEPLIIAIIFPLYRYAPWSLKGSKLLGSLGGDLQAVWKTMPERSRFVLRELCSKARTLEGMPSGVVRELLSPFRERPFSYCSPRKRRRRSTSQSRG